MNLSYVLRLLCLLAVIFALVYAAVQTLLAVCSSFLLLSLERSPARRRERILYLLQIAPLLLAILIDCAVCLPDFLWYEPTHDAEPVSRLSLLVAGAVSLWFGTACVRGFRVAFRTGRFTAVCRRDGRVASCPDSLIPIVALPEPNPPVGLIGFIHPLVVISADLLEVGGLQPETLKVALDHEHSHAAQLDNWKLLTLSFLPRLHVDFWQEHWRTAADCAADDDAVRGNPARSLLLAEALVRTARSTRNSRSPVIYTALTTTDTVLAIRIDRLLHPRRASRFAGILLPLGLGVLALLTVGTAIVGSPWMYRLSEQILHLGGF